MITDICILLIFTLFAVNGYKKGFIKSVYSIISLVATILLVSLFKDNFIRFISNTSLGVAIGEFFATDSHDPILVKLCSEKIVYLAFVVIFYVVVRILLKFALTIINSIASLPLVNSLNKFLGVIVGMIIGVIWIAIIIGVLSGMPQTKEYVIDSIIIEYFHIIFM